MDDSYAGQAVVLIASLLVMSISFGAFGAVYMWSFKSLGALGKSLQSGLQRAGRAATNAGKKGAMNSKYGQAAQQFMGQRKAIGQMKGKEALRSTLNNNPNLAKLMGGMGGQQYASRFLNQENRKHEAEQIQDLSKNISLPMANSMARGQSLTQAVQDGAYRNKNGQLERDRNGELKNKLSAEDREGIRQMQNQGYLDQNGRVGAGHPHSAIAASAALQEIYNSDDVTPDKVQGLGSLLRGAGVEANSNFSKLNRDLAVRGKNKNVAFASFDDGVMDQYKGKKPDGILASGLQGMNKDALKPSTHDVNLDGSSMGENLLLKELHNVTHNPDGSRNYSAVLERTKQTMDQNHQEVLQGLSDSMGFASVEEFKALRTAMNSGGGAEALPVEFRAAAGGGITPPTAPPATPPTAPPAAPPAPPQLIIPHTPPAPTNRPRPSNFPPAGPPPPAGP